MGSEPVFRDSSDVRIWRKLNSEKINTSDDRDIYANLADTLIKRETAVNSHILSKLIWMLHLSQNNNISTLADRLAAKSRPNDSMPALTAALVYARIEKWDKAEKLIDSVNQTQNLPMLCCVKAEIAMGTGDKVSAKKELMKARCSDPAFPMFYELIRRLEPVEGWTYIQNTEIIFEGGQPIPVKDDERSGSAQLLYEIYRNWYSGNRDKATQLMIDSEDYKRKDPGYVLASARMSMDEKDWHSAQRMYSSLFAKNQNCVYIVCETAKAFYSGANFEKALSLYRHAEALDPASPTVMRGLIQTYSALGMKGEASQCIKEFLDTENSCLKDHVSGAKMLLSYSMSDDAEAILQNILVSYPTCTDAFILRSELEFEKGNINAALRAITAGIEIDPNDAEMRAQRAKIYFRTGRTDKALADLRKAESKDPDNAGVLLLLKEIAEFDNDNERAIDLSKRLLKIEPNNLQAKNTLSKATLSARSQEGSYNSYKDMMLADNRAENLINILSSMMAEGKYADAIRMYGEKEREFGNRAMVKRLKGNAEYALGDYRAAKQSFKSASALDPKDPMMWYSLGMAEEALGDTDLAEEAYNKAILLDMYVPDFWISRAAVQEKRGDREGAVESLNKAIELRPDDVYALVKKGMIFAEFGKFEDAVYFLGLAELTDPENIETLRIYRDISSAAGNIEKAEELALKILESEPSNDDAVSSAVEILVSNGKIDEAAKIIKKASATDSVSLLLTCKEFYSYRKDHKGVIDVCSRLLDLQPDNDMIRTELAEAYFAIGDVNSANRIYSEIKDTAGDDIKAKRYAEETTPKHRPKVPDIVKRYAERVLRRAYITKTAVNDPQIISALGLDEMTSKAVIDYLSDISEYGEITPGTPEFERMETLSMNAIVKGGCTGLDKDPIITIPCAYVAGGAKDADEAKMLVAYIFKAMESKRSRRPIPPETQRSTGKFQKGVKTEEIMRTAGVGVYQAKIIKDNL